MVTVGNPPALPAPSAGSPVAYPVTTTAGETRG